MSGADITLRDDGPEDADRVRALIVDAFGREAEADLVEALKENGDCALSMVAEAKGDLVGYVLFSRLQQPPGCLAMAPVAVTSRFQGRGVGAALIRQGLAWVKEDGWRAVFVLGDPAYYERFGFSLGQAEKFETDYPKSNFLALPLAPDALSDAEGEVVYAAPFLAME